MKQKILICLLCFIAMQCIVAQQKAMQRAQWVTGYIASWTLNMGAGTDGNYGNMPYQAIDLDAFTHVIMFAVAINQDGSLRFNNLVPSRRKPFNDYVHSKGKPILISLGGAGNDAFSAALQQAARSVLIRNLIDLVLKEEYDGIDIDIEGFQAKDTTNLGLFIRELHSALQKYKPFYDSDKDLLLTCAIYNHEKFWAGVSDYFDQINLMSYDMFGTWFGKSWHNNAPYGGKNDVDQYGVPMTTVEVKMNKYLKAGIPKHKFGVGVDFNGWIWKGGIRDDNRYEGITAPRQRWIQPPKTVYGKETQYFKLRKEYIDSAGKNLHFDSVAMVPYIGINAPGHSEDYYITFQDTSTVREIIHLASRAGIGGIIVWEVGGGYLGQTDFPVERYPSIVRDPLLQAVKKYSKKYFTLPSSKNSHQ